MIVSKIRRQELFCSFFLLGVLASEGSIYKDTKFSSLFAPFLFYNTGSVSIV